MLVLTRKLNEAIRIGAEVEVRVLGIEGNQVRLGILAPRSIPVHREEVYREILRENQEAARAAPRDLPVTVDPVASDP
ncbi:MAG: carbon storage regulator CsrA [Armatimonadota bacterium]|nr:carbon storage regulator CsrA [Armatimonadota bacterium]MDR7438850.1 carbon storage regulator CsrA [Armatimonadota bacterium]MDR7562391.1 carbon storage regulator CsrA [Armatimonadota bacterium]MDR7568935.1 carbon storage regulator CsrA [Armatimonadota bacterium]MDR7601471.1 carbon storage regulator CsrA [Armatimonadota bacterium]